VFEWRFVLTDASPIATAPKDGTTIDVRVVRLKAGSEAELDAQWLSGVKWGQVRGDGFDLGDSWVRPGPHGTQADVATAPYRQATHWRRA
jgi:hypothetical protein